MHRIGTTTAAVGVIYGLGGQGAISAHSGGCDIGEGCRNRGGLDDYFDILELLAGCWGGSGDRSWKWDWLTMNVGV